MPTAQARLKRLRDRMPIAPSACLHRLRCMTEVYGSFALQFLVRPPKNK